jgi:murein DD-endopeptidase MepM/ murein hydrolase activator NlpD
LTRLVERRAFLLGLAGPLLAAPASAEEVVRRVGAVTFRADTTRAFPGGVLVARLGSRGRIGAAWALLDGRRAPFYAASGVPRALVPLSADAEPGPATLGVGLAARKGEQRIVIPVEIAARAYERRNVYVGEDKRELLRRPDAARDARRLLAAIRTVSDRPAPGPLDAPVAGAGRGFGEPRVYTGFADAESRTDGLQGERHRGLDYAVPAGTSVRAPGAGRVVFAGPLVLSGETVAIDHGQGIVSVLQHLSRVFVKPGDALAAGADVGVSGATGFAPEPMLQWRVYLHAVAVDPLVLAAVLGRG